MDFYRITEKADKDGNVTLYPDFKSSRSKDLMVRGKSFYAIWDEDLGIWSKDPYDVQRLVDEDLEKHSRESIKPVTHVKYLLYQSTNSMANFNKMLREMGDSMIQLDNNVTYLTAKTEKSDYSSKRLPYDLIDGPCNAYNEIIGTLYNPEERAKLEWAIGSVLTGDAKHIHKFIVLYGEPGSGKSTILNIIQMLFEGYYTSIDARDITSPNNQFATESFRDNPLVAIQHDGDISLIKDLTRLNSIVSHEVMSMKEKYKPSYDAVPNAFIFMGTNQPVDTKFTSGMVRRLIDVIPSGNKIPVNRYYELMRQVEYELGAIANHCLKVYKSMGKDFYEKYEATIMLYKTDMFYNFVEDKYFDFKNLEEGITLKDAYTLYKAYNEDANIKDYLTKPRFRDELMPYFEKFEIRTRMGTERKQVWHVFSNFKFWKLHKDEEKPESIIPVMLSCDDEYSRLDTDLAFCKAQYGNKDGFPISKWEHVTTTISDLDTTRLHYLLPPENHIMIDFDLMDEKGEKSLERNLEAASKWPTTYTEYSKSGLGIHLHYIYNGDVSRLASIYSEGIEIKTFTGKASLRRKLTKCNNSPIATISSGLPLKGEKKMVDKKVIEDENHLRIMIKKNLNKDIHPGTKPSIDFIYKLLDDAYTSGMKYDVTDLRTKVLTFANNSTNQADTCLKLVSKMKFKSDEPSINTELYQDDELIFFDVEVFPNLLVVVYKKEGKDPVKLINPTAEDISELIEHKLVGFNNRNYDNHILYGRYLGWDNSKIYDLSQKIISNSPNAKFGEAYNLSYADVYDFAATKQSLKKWEVDLGLHHQELGLPWEEDVPEDKWALVAEYCVNDVLATEATFKHLAGDWVARQILADLSGLTLNDTTNSHSKRIIFGSNRKPQDQFVYTDLSEMFPGYVFDRGKSTYRDEEVGEGGYVYSEPGMYTNVAILDVASQHPTSIEQLNLFGDVYTKVFSELKQARIAIKRNETEKLKNLLGGKLYSYMTGEFNMKDLSSALKIVINSVYGLTSAKFTNEFKDPRNIDNIVAKRGALFMIDLKHAVQERGFQVVHIKTDSIKIPNATKDIIDFVMEFGKRYGYEFEHEDTYQKFCLVNDAVYIAKTQEGKWEAVGTQFIQPYVFKMLFSKESIRFEDMCEIKSVTSPAALYLDMNENLGDDEHNYIFIGKTGLFCPIKKGHGGGIIWRKKDDKYYAATGTKGYRWLESEMVQSRGIEDSIDVQYYNELVEAAIENVSRYGDFEWFVSDDPVMPEEEYPIGVNDPAVDNFCGEEMMSEKCVVCEDMKDCPQLPF